MIAIIFMMTSHINYMLVCNTGEIMKICTGCTWFLGGMYGTYISSQRDAFGTGLETYNCNYMMKSDVNYMSICNIGETMKTCTRSTRVLWKYVLGYIASPPCQLGTGMHH